MHDMVVPVLSDQCLGFLAVKHSLRVFVILIPDIPVDLGRDNRERHLLLAFAVAAEESLAFLAAPHGRLVHACSRLLNSLLTER